MPIYTKKGDKGETSLFGGARVTKDNPQIEATGTIDEFSSFIGLASSLSTEEKEKKMNLKIQKNLYLIMGIIAGYKQPVNNLDKDISEVEKEIDFLESQMPKLNNFIVPGGSQSSAIYHVARSVCRRAERRIVSLFYSKKILIDKEELLKSIKYLNRLSDFLFTMARFKGLENEKVFKENGRL